MAPTTGIEPAKFHFERVVTLPICLHGHKKFLQNWCSQRKSNPLSLYKQYSGVSKPVGA